MSTSGEHGFGAALVAPDRTRFRFWAPAQKNPAIVVDGRAPIAMKATGEGWFEAEADCGAGARYLFRLDDGMMVPDPASRAQAGDVHDPSLVVDPDAYSWRCADWKGRPWEETVIYELHVGLLGGFRGVEAKLPALARLGVTAVELMPIADFPGPRNWGYDGVLPYAPDAAYGTPEELKALVDRAHELGLMIFLDVVYNHFGPDGNYLGLYAPHFFRDDLHTPWGGAIDFRRPQVRRFFADNVRYWLTEFRFDGLRFDAVHAIKQTDWLVETARAARSAVGPERHVHLMLENEHNDAALLEGAYDAQWNDDVHHCLHVMLTGEHHGYYGNYVRDTAGKLARGLSEGFVYQGELPENGEGAARGTPSAHLPPTAFVDCLQNHDQIGNRAFGERLSVLADPAAVKAATALLLLSPHIPMIFMGEETGAREPFLFFTSHNDELAELVRKGRRKELAAFPEFADPAKRERIPDPNATSTFEASRPRVAGEGGDEEQLAFYTKLLELRRGQIVPRLKGARAREARALGEKAVVARWIMGDGALLTIALNLADAPQALPEGVKLPEGTPLHAVGAPARPTSALPPHAAIVWLENAA